MNLKPLASLATAVALIGGITLGVGLLTDEPTAPTQDLVSGTIRWVDASTWTVLNDAGHADDGLDWASPLSDRVRVYYDQCHATVGSLQVTPDESFTSAGVRVGASVGLCYADVYFYMGTSATPVNPALLSKAGANVWITGLFHPAEVGR